MGLFTLIPVHASEISKQVLDNGMTVILMENHSAPIVNIRIYIRTGSIYEGDYSGSGISHFLEHLVTTGTKKRPKDVLDREIDELGGAFNAYTSKDHTCYYISTASAYFDKALDIITDMVKNPSLTQENFEIQRGIILKEINMGMDEPDRYIYHLFNEVAFRTHPQRYPIIGYRELFEKLTRDDILSYYRSTYAPNNMVFVAVGDFDSDEVLRKVKDSFADFERRSINLPELPNEPRQLATRSRAVERDLEMAYMLLGFHTVSIAHPDLYPLDVLSYILSKGRSSRLYKKLKDGLGLVQKIETWSDTPPYDAGIFGIYSVLPPENIDAAQKAIKDEISRLKTEYVSEVELAKAKRQKISNYIFAGQTVQDQAGRLGIDELSTGDVHFSENYVRNIQKVTKEDIMRVMRKYFNDNNLSVAILQPKRAEELIPEQKIGARPEAGKIRKEVLPNGLTLLVKENPTIPLVAIQAMFRGGLRVENTGDNGISNFTVRMLLRGTERRSREDITTLIDSIGGEISTFSDDDLFGLSVSVLKEDLETGLDLLFDLIKNPKFDEDQMEKERRDIKAEIKSREDDWLQHAEDMVRGVLYTRHPYHLNPLGTESTISAIKREDIVAFHRRYIVPNNMVLAVFGDVEGAKVKELVGRFSKGFRRAELHFPEVSTEPPLLENRKEIEETEREQTVIFIGYPGMSVDSPDRYAMKVLDGVISGIGYPSGWLHRDLRGNRLVYVVHAFNQLAKDPGYFGIFAATTADKLDTTLAIISHDIDRIKTELVSEEELRVAKQMCITMKALYTQKNSDQAKIAARDELLGLGYDFSERYEENINSITAEDVKRVANKYLNNYAIVISKPKG